MVCIGFQEEALKKGCRFLHLRDPDPPMCVKQAFAPFTLDSRSFAEVRVDQNTTISEREALCMRCWCVCGWTCLKRDCSIFCILPRDEALFLQEHLSAYKVFGFGDSESLSSMFPRQNGSDFFLAHAIYRSVPSHTVRKRYKAGSCRRFAILASSADIGSGGFLEQTLSPAACF